MGRWIDAEVLEKCVEESLKDNPHTEGIVRRTHDHEHMHFMKMICEQPTVGEWIPFKLRKADEKEKEMYDAEYMLDGELPDDNEEILVTYDSGCVGVDTFLRDGLDCYLDGGCEFCTEAVAWKPLPEPYKPNKTTVSKLS